jgi:hypothetical protein
LHSLTPPPPSERFSRLARQLKIVNVTNLTYVFLVAEAFPRITPTVLEGF